MTEKIFMLWREFYGVFKKDQRKMFMLAILQNVRLSLQAIVMTQPLVFLALPAIGIALFHASQGPYLLSFKSLYLLLIAATMLFVVFASLFIVARPSLERKDFVYVWGYLSKFFLSFALLFPVIVLCPFIGFFVLDETPGYKGALRAVGQGLLVLLYALPVVFLLYATLLVLVFSSFLLSGFLAKLGFFSALFAGIPLSIVMQLVISVHAVFYTRIKHTQHQFFFN